MSENKDLVQTPFLYERMKDVCRFSSGWCGREANLPFPAPITHRKIYFLFPGIFNTRIEKKVEIYWELEQVVRKIICILAFLLTIGTSTKAQKRLTATEYFEKGEVSLEKKEYFSAQAHFTECLRIDPLYAEAYRLRGITREHLGERAKALTDYNVYVDLKPNDPEAHFSRAILRFESGQYLLARQDFLMLLTLPPVETNTIYYRQEKYNAGATKIFTASHTGKDQIFNYLGLIETKVNRNDKAISWMDSALHLAPDNPSYWINRGTIKFDRKDYKGAMADLEEAIKLEPDNSLALHNMATVKSAMGETSASEILLSEAIEKNKDLPFPLAERGYQRLLKNDLKGALEDYDEVVRLEPLDEENFINRGLVKEKMKDLSGALKDFAKAIEINDKNERAWLSHGNIMSKMKNWNEAIDDYNVAIILDGTYALAFFNRAMAHVNVKNATAACKDLKRSEELGLRIEENLKKKICP